RTLRPPHSRRNVTVRPGGTLAAAQRHSPGAVMRRMLPSSPMLAIDAHDVAKTFKSGWLRPTRIAALRGVSLAVPRGAIVGLLGPNGAGKTTLLSILATLLTPDSGTVRVLGHDVVRDAARLRRRLNMASGRPSFLWSLRVGEIVAFYGRLYGLSGQKLRRRVDEPIELCERGARRAPLRRGGRLGRVHGGRGREAAARPPARPPGEGRRGEERAGEGARAGGGVR